MENGLGLGFYDGIGIPRLRQTLIGRITTAGGRASVQSHYDILITWNPGKQGEARKQARHDFSGEFWHLFESRIVSVDGN